MTVFVKKTAGNRAEITWNPAEDDARGYLARAVESDQLACALEALGSSDGLSDPTADEDYAVTMAKNTAGLARLLERRAAVQVVKLRDHYGLSWRRIAVVLFDDAEKQSSVRRMYDSGRRHIGI